MKKIPKLLWHHGTCDHCNKRLKLCLHFGYDTQPKSSYRICKECLAKNIHYILFGKDHYKSGLLDAKCLTRPKYFKQK